MSQLESQEKDKVVGLVCKQVFKESSPCRIHDAAFYHLDPTKRVTRAAFAQELMQSLGSATNNLKPYILAEGFVLIYGNFVHFHLDALNNNKASPPMNDTLVAVNCLCISIISKLAWVPNIHVGKVMEVFHLEVGYHQSFSLVIYSRKCMADFLKRQLWVTNIMHPYQGKESNLPTGHWLISPLWKAIKQLEQCEVNFNAIWDKHNSLNDYMARVDTDVNGNQHQGDFMSLVAASFDKMRYWSLIKYLFDALHARKVTIINGKHAMRFTCFMNFCVWIHHKTHCSWRKWKNTGYMVLHFLLQDFARIVCLCMAPQIMQGIGTTKRDLPTDTQLQVEWGSWNALVTMIRKWLVIVVT